MATPTLAGVIASVAQGAPAGWNQRDRALVRDSAGNLWFAGTNAANTTYTLYKSTDNGVTWTSDGQIGGVNAASGRGYGLAISADNTIYLCWRDSDNTDYVIKRTAVGTWVTKFSGIVVNGDEATTTLLCHPTDAAKLYICFGYEIGGGTQTVGLYKSTDTGATWGSVQNASGQGYGGGFHIYQQGASAFAMGSDGVIHAVACPCVSAAYNLLHWSYDTATSTWSGSDSIYAGIGSGNFDKFTALTLCLDSNNKCHMVAHANDATVAHGTVYQAHYFTNASGSWSAAGVYPYGAANATYNQFYKIAYCIGTAPVFIGTMQGNGTNSTHFNIVMCSKETGSWVKTMVTDSTTDYGYGGGINSGGRTYIYDNTSSGYYFTMVGTSSYPGFWSSSDLVWRSAHDPNIAVTVTHNLHFESLPMLPGAEETTAFASYSKIGLGGRMMTRIGSRIYAVAVDASKTYVVYSDDEAETWHSEQVVNWPAVAAAITQGAGSQPVLALARSGFPRILTYLRAGAGSWTAGATTVSAGTNDLESFQILYDNTNYHLVYAGYNTSTGAKTVYHRKTTSIASWPAATAVDVGDIPRTGANRDRALSAVLDKDGDIHLVYTQSVSNRFSLRYRKYAASAWSAATEIEDLGSSLTESNRCVHLSITTTGAKIPWIFGVKWNGSLVKQIYAWSKPVSTWTAEGVLATQNADQEYPSSGVQNLDIPSVVFSGNFVDGRIQYLEKRNGAWARECVSADYTNNKPDQVYDPFRKNAQTLEGAFITVSGSIDVIVTTVLVWGDGAYASGGAGFTQNIFIKGRDKVNNTLSFTQTIGLSHGYTNTFTHGAAFTSIVVLTRTLPRSVSKGVLLTQAIGLTAILGGVTTYYKHVAHSLVFDSVFTRGVREQHQTVTHSLVFHQVGPGLTRYKSVASQIEFVDDSAASSIKHDTATTNVGLESVVFLNKSLNLTVTHGLAFGSAPVRVRAWVWNSTHFDPGWAAEYEASVSDFLIMGPDEAPTIEITLPKPDMDDENVLFRREQSVRRNRTGSAKSFVTPVYQEFKYQWSGFLRKRAEEFRHAIGPLLGKNVRIRDHNGVWHSVKITDTRITSTQKSPEYVVVGLTFEKNEAVY